MGPGSGACISYSELVVRIRTNPHGPGHCLSRRELGFEPEEQVVNSKRHPAGTGDRTRQWEGPVHVEERSVDLIGRLSPFGPTFFADSPRHFEEQRPINAKIGGNTSKTQETLSCG